MPKRAIVLVHRGSPTTAFFVAACREKNIEPIVLSSAAPTEVAERFRSVCAELHVFSAMGKPVLDMDDIVRFAHGSLSELTFCLAAWDGQRALMAETNTLLGAPDVRADAIRGVQDKYRFRQMLRTNGLSRIVQYSLADPFFSLRLESGSAFIVKPRRSAGGLCTGRVTCWDDVERLRDSFAAGPSGDDDLFEEFFCDNELFAEEFIEGTEFSFEVVRRNGATLFMCEHEKLSVTFTGTTVLESNFVSPAISVTPAELDAAKSLVDAALDLFGLRHGCYHVEARFDGRRGWELLEINPRPGGALINESVRRQYGRSMLHDWLDILSGGTPAQSAQRSAGTLFQIQFAQEARRIIGLRTNAAMREPDVFRQVVSEGAYGRANREEIASVALWCTDLANHAAAVKELAAQDYATVLYDTATPLLTSQRRR